MYEALEPPLYPLFAPLPAPMIAHLQIRLERMKRATHATSLRVLLQLVREKRVTAYFYMDPFVRTRINGGPASASFSTGWLLRTLGSLSSDKKPVSQKTLSYWRGKGLVRFQSHGLPDYASAAALYIARMIDNDAERNFLPTSMTQEEQDWWCFTQAAPHAPVVPWRASHLNELPASTLCWTPWTGAVWEPGWIRRSDQRLAMRWARLAPRSARASISPDELAGWDPACAPLLVPGDPDILQASAQLVLHRLGRQRLMNNYDSDALLL